MLLSLTVKDQPPKYAPVRHLMMYLTEECNLRCSYCFVKKEPRFMTRDVALRTVDFLLQRTVSGGVYDLFITFFGGEPFLAVDRMQEVVDYARERRLNQNKIVHFAATTNGTLANARVQKVVQEGAMSLLISLDGGPRANRQRPMVSGRESYSRVARNLEKLAAWSPRSLIRVTYTPENLNLAERVREVLALAPLGLVVSPVVEADWNGHEQALEEAYRELEEWFLQEFSQGRRPPLESTWELLRTLTNHLSCQQRPSKACPLGDSILGIDSQGHVLPCHRFLHQPLDRLGTVAQDRLPAERWRYVELHTLEISDCATCEVRRVCGGGCRAVALQAGYGLKGVHPHHCLLLRTHFRMAWRIHQALQSQDRYWRYLNQFTSSEVLRELSQLGS